jgi:hypothetical protein
VFPRIALFCFCGAASLVASSFEGIVIDGTTGQPLRKALVNLIGTQGSRSAISGPDGHFAASELPVGEYLVRVEHQGYLDCDCLAGVKIGTDQKITGVQIKLTQYGSIAGRVVDPDGDVWPRGTAILYRLTWRHGKRKLDENEQAEIDDRGMFRVGKLAPGRYYIALKPGGQRAGLTPLPYQTTFYPGALDPVNAVAVPLRAGQEVNGIEIKLQSVDTYSVRGRITGLDRLDFSGSGISFDIIRASDLFEDMLDSPVDRKRDGTFEFRGVPSGSYIVKAGSVSRRNNGVSFASLGEAAVQVNGHDVNDVVVDLIPPRELKINVEVEGMSHPDLSAIGIAMSSDEGSFETASVETGFALANVAATAYFVSLGGRGASNYFVKSIRAGNTEFPGSLLDLRRTGVVPITVVLSDKGAGLNIALKTDSPDPANTTVLLIPDIPDAALRERRVKELSADQNNIYAVKNVPPGDYRLFAWRDIEEEAWNDPDFWNLIRERGVSVKLRDSDRQSIEIPLIPAAEMTGILARLGLQ